MSASATQTIGVTLPDDAAAFPLRNAEERDVFEEIRALKRRLLPNEKMILFGSRARGDAREDSDWDLLVLLDKDEINFNEDFDKYAAPFTPIGLNHGTPVSIIFKTKKNWETRPSMLKYFVEKEGVEIV